MSEESFIITLETI